MIQAISRHHTFFHTRHFVPGFCGSSPTGFVKLYLKSLVKKTQDMPDYTMLRYALFLYYLSCPLPSLIPSIVAEIGGYSGLLLGFSLLDCFSLQETAVAYSRKMLDTLAKQLRSELTQNYLLSVKFKCIFLAHCYELNSMQRNTSATGQLKVSPKIHLTLHVFQFNAA